MGREGYRPAAAQMRLSGPSDSRCGLLRVYCSMGGNCISWVWQWGGLPQPCHTQYGTAARLCRNGRACRQLVLRYLASSDGAPAPGGRRASCPPPLRGYWPHPADIDFACHCWAWHPGGQPMGPSRRRRSAGAAAAAGHCSHSRAWRGQRPVVREHSGTKRAPSAALCRVAWLWSIAAPSFHTEDLPNNYGVDDPSTRAGSLPCI